MTDNITDSFKQHFANQEARMIEIENNILEKQKQYYANRDAQYLKIQNTILDIQKELRGFQIEDYKEKIKNLKDDLKSSERNADFYFNLWRKKSDITVEKMVS